MIPSPESVAFVIDALNELGAPYIITGSIASNAYSEARSTIDADFVVDINATGLEWLQRRLAQQFVVEAQLAFETVTGKTQHKFRDPRNQFLVEIFEARMDDPHERARFDRRLRATLLERPTFFPTAEDVIVQKLRWFRQIRRAKDREDVSKVLLHQWQILDWPYVERWCREHGTLDLLSEIKGEVQRLLA